MTYDREVQKLSAGELRNYTNRLVSEGCCVLRVACKTDAIADVPMYF